MPMLLVVKGLFPITRVLSKANLKFTMTGLPSYGVEVAQFSYVTAPEVWNILPVNNNKKLINLSKNILF